MGLDFTVEDMFTLRCRFLIATTAIDGLFWSVVVLVFFFNIFSGSYLAQFSFLMLSNGSGNGV